MATYSVESERLIGLSGTVNNRNNDVHQTLATLKGEVDQVVGQEWTGNASGAFHQLYTEWQSSAAKLQEALQGIGTLLNSAGQQYAQTESAIANSMNS